jgi:hypothetical protein
MQNHFTCYKTLRSEIRPKDFCRLQSAHAAEGKWTNVLKTNITVIFPGNLNLHPWNLWRFSGICVAAVALPGNVTNSEDLIKIIWKSERKLISTCFCSQRIQSTPRHQSKGEDSLVRIVGYWYLLRVELQQILGSRCTSARRIAFLILADIFL